MNTLNWILTDEATYNKANIYPSPYARRWEIDTPNGIQTVILEHVQPHLHLEHPEYTMRSRILSSCLLTNEELQFLLPVEEEGLSNENAIDI